MCIVYYISNIYLTACVMLRDSLSLVTVDAATTSVVVQNDMQFVSVPNEAYGVRDSSREEHSLQSLPLKQNVAYDKFKPNTEQQTDSVVYDTPLILTLHEQQNTNTDHEYEETSEYI